MKRLTVLMAAVFVLFSAQLYSQPHDAKMVKKFMEKLNLTDEQKKEVEKIHADAEKQAIAQKAKGETARVDLQQLLKADVPDKSAIEKKINDISDQQAQMKMIRVNSWFAINKLLNPEQQKTWKKALEHGQELRAHRMMNEIREHRKRIPHPETPMKESE
ncbi:MAG: periplasmic heavy metal sensor [Ignavibacteriae bacterium]|nr:MAG: periplasmic heavy metal sensor [Ignavibacteriota bacterium]